jgi:lipopolysaccharide/colanic/teichoic acid biosynthesis glycosyltransferase
MRVHTPTSIEQVKRYIDLSDLFSVIVAAPIALALRDPNLFAFAHNVEAAIYSSVAFIVGGLMVFVFNLGKNVRGLISMNEVQSVVLAALSAVSVTALIVFSFTRLDFVPRTVPLIHVLVLASLMLTARAIATKRRRHRERRNKVAGTDPNHILLIGANRLAWSYLRMLNVLDMGRSDVVAILDEDPKLFGRSVLGYPVLAPPSELSRVVNEYAVHGVHINSILIAANRHADESELWMKLEDYCRDSSISVGFLGDILGMELGQPPAASREPVEAPAPKMRAYLRVKRVFDFCLALALSMALAPVFAIVALGVLIDLGWPITFWQKRDGKDGEPFLIYKIRTMHAPFDRRGRFVEEDRRASRFGVFLRRTRLDELPQLWNVLTGAMSFVGPRPLLPVDQPSTSKYRLQLPPGLTGWAQIHGGKRVDADDKGLLDDWYVEHASFWLDISIILRTGLIVVLGDERIEAMSALGSARNSKGVRRASNFPPVDVFR